MAQARITVNGVAGSNDDVPINTLVQLGNQGNGGEATYAWQIAYQPPGAADALSSNVIANPTFTPTREGTYRITLEVNGSTDLEDSVIVAVRQLKTGLRVPAAGETSENSAAQGWAEPSAANDLLRRVDGLLAHPVMCAAVADATVTAAAQVVALAGAATIKAGLPGQEILPQAVAADPANANIGNMRLGLVMGAVRGGAIANGTLIWVLLLGVYQTPIVLAEGAAPPVAGDPVFLGALGALTLDIAGPQVGYVLAATAAGGSNYNVTVMVDR